MVDYEIAVIGGGIVGCAVFDKLVLNGIKTVLIEKGEDVSLGATKANSGIVHAGYDCVPRTLKAELNVKGNLMYEKMTKRLGEKITKCGSLVVCKREDLSGLEELRDRGILNGINNLRIVEKEELKKMEPNLSEDICYGLYAPSAKIVSPYNICIALYTFVHLQTCAEIHIEMLLVYRHVVKSDRYSKIMRILPVFLQP